MTSTDLAPAAPSAAIYESLALKGDISGLKPEERVAFYRGLCERLGLDPMTQPFLPLRLNGKEVLYASKAATDQLARLHNVNRQVVSRERIEDVYAVTVRASLPNNRTEDSIGAVPLGNLKGEALANALMKAETKAKRRATLSILGLGMLDESELETIPQRAMQPVAPIMPVQDVTTPTAHLTRAQLDAIAGILKRLPEEAQDPATARAFIGWLAGREIKGAADLTADEAEAVLDLLTTDGQPDEERYLVNWDRFVSDGAGDGA